MSLSDLAVDLKNPPGSVYRGEPKGQKANCTMQLSDEDFAALAMGQLNPQQVSVRSFEDQKKSLEQNDASFWLLSSVMLICFVIMTLTFFATTL